VITFACFKWRGPDPERFFLPLHVNTLYRMLAANYRNPFRFVCITDDGEGLLPEIETLPLPDMVDIPAPNGDRFPSCYRRLWLWSAEAAQVLPGQVVCMDIDLVITGDVTELFTRSEDCVMWADPDHKSIKYSGGLWLIRTGTRTHVWDDFDPIESPKLTRAAGLLGSDQAWLSYCLDGEAVWTRKDGIYRTRNLTPDCEPLLIQTPNNKSKPWMQAFMVRYRPYADIWWSYATEPQVEYEEVTEMARFKLLKTSTKGRKGEVIEVMPTDVQALRLNGIIGEPVREPEVQKVVEAPVQKVIEPTVKKRGRRARKAAN